MSDTTTDQETVVAADELDLMPYINILLERWWIPLVSALLLAALTAVMVYHKPYRFESTARVSIIDIEDPGGVSPDDRRASEVLTLVEHGFVMGTTYDNYNEVMLARLRSRKFLQRFLEEHNIYRHYFRGQWQEATGDWAPDFEPDRGAVLTWFRQDVLGIEIDEETQIISISMKSQDAIQAREWANAYVASFNHFMRERTLNDVARKHTFLREALAEAEVLEIQQSLYRLIEAQTAVEMLASARDEYVLEVIDPAALPYRSFNMTRKKRVLLAGVGGGLAGIFLLFAWVFANGILQTVKAHRNTPPLLIHSR